jgi:predicted CXXCH cytochrome family protein
VTRKGLLGVEYVAGAGPIRGAWLRLILFPLYSVILAILISLYVPIPAQAVGPHGPFNTTTEKCEKCHSMHAAGTQTLLTKKNNMELCESCHSAGIGADTAVMQGALMKPSAPDSKDYVNSGSLLGGGFETIGGSSSTTSRHNLSSMAVPPGAEDTGAAIQLDCLSCHTPHEGLNYRLLRQQINGDQTDYRVTWNGPCATPDGTLDYSYAENDMDPNTPGIQNVTYNYQSGLSAWCSGCHSQYMAANNPDGTPNANRGGPGATPYNAGDEAGATVRYRHAVDVPIKSDDPLNPVHNINPPYTTYSFTTDLPLNDTNGNGRDSADTITCLTCHKAHGSNAIMAEETILNADGDRGGLPSGTDSMLLRLDNREVCQTACHKVVN